MGTSAKIIHCVTFLGLLTGALCFWQGHAEAKNTGKHSPAEIKKIHAPIRAALRKYRHRIKSRLVKHKLRPSGKNKGSAVIVFTVLRSGTVSNLRISHRSGNKKIDRAALAMVIYASPFPRIPRGGPRRMKFKIKISYR